jgi:hypothetical protein
LSSSSPSKLVAYNTAANNLITCIQSTDNTLPTFGYNHTNEDVVSLEDQNRTIEFATRSQFNRLKLFAYSQHCQSLLGLLGSCAHDLAPPQCWRDGGHNLDDVLVRLEQHQTQQQQTSAACRGVWSTLRTHMQWLVSKGLTPEAVGRIFAVCFDARHLQRSKWEELIVHMVTLEAASGSSGSARRPNNTDGNNTGSSSSSTEEEGASTTTQRFNHNHASSNRSAAEVPISASSFATTTTTTPAAKKKKTRLSSFGVGGLGLGLGGAGNEFNRRTSSSPGSSSSSKQPRILGTRTPSKAELYGTAGDLSPSGSGGGTLATTGSSTTLRGGQQQYDDDDGFDTDF